MAGRVIPNALSQGQTIAQGSPPWPISSVGGDNPTPWYIHLPGLAPGYNWVYPFTYGWMYPVTPPSIQPITIDGASTPPGFPPAQAGSTAQASISFFEDPQPPSSGRSAVNVAQQWISVGRQAGILGAGSFTTQLVPANAAFLGLFLDFGTLLANLKILGAQSGDTYLPTTTSGAPFNKPLMVPINPQLDSSYVISYGAGASGAFGAFATSFPYAYPALGIQSAGLSIPVVLASDQPTPGGVSATAFSGAAAVGTYTTVLPGTGDKGIIVYVQTSGGGAGTANVTIQNTDPQALMSFNVVSTGALGSGSTAGMSVYPGITVSASAISAVLGRRVVLQLVIAGATLSALVEYDRIP